MTTAILLACLACAASTPGAVAPAATGYFADSTLALANPVAKAPVADAAPSAPVNTPDTVIDDMKLRNDFVLKGYEKFEHGWYVGPGNNTMGNNPAFSNNPEWSIFYKNPTYAGKVAKAVLPWVVILDGVNHAASNTAVEMRNMRTYIKSRSTGKWVLRGNPSSTTGLYYGKPSTNLPARDEVVLRRAGASSTVKVPENRGYFWHGWSNAGRLTIDPTDIAAILVTVQARLMVADPSKPDDRHKAQLGLQVGADYYLTMSSTYPEAYAPAVGVSRTKTITTNWRAFNFMTFSDVGGQDPGGGISEAAFRTSPPPLE